MERVKHDLLFKDWEYREVFEDNQYPILHHVCQMELKKGQSFQAMHSHKNSLQIKSQ